jgi:methylenetetrahydrofolate dehydrogenase (NADP+)/methenyltetrahydrofolate cyclohydrolase
MLATILDGRKIRDEAISKLKEAFSKMREVPILAIVQVGDREDTNAYIKAKRNFADKIGVNTVHIKLPLQITEEQLMVEVRKLNEDKKIKGIIVQLPLPEGIDRNTVIDTIVPEKDVDAITPSNVKRWADGVQDALLPATAQGVKTLLKEYGVDLQGKKVAVIGRSTLVGKPIASMCLSQNATVTICHSKTVDLKEVTLNSDIIIVAVGKINLITKDHVRAGQVVIDVGINTYEGKKLDDEIVEKKIVGDVDFLEVSKIVSAITPVPGGVGPLTVFSVFQNLLALCNG